MATAVKLPDEVVNTARIMAKASHRSIAKQIEHWVQIGRIVEENPDLPTEMIKNILIAREEVRSGQAKPFSFED